MSDKRVCLHPDCQGEVLLADGRCWNHSTLVSDEERAEARVKGGAASRRRFEVTAEDLEEHRIEPTAEAALQVQLDAIAAMRATLAANPSDTKTQAQLSLAAKRLSQQVLAADIEVRVREIEEELGKRRPKKRK